MLSRLQPEFLTGCFGGLPSKCAPRQLWNFAFAGADIDGNMYGILSETLRLNSTEISLNQSSSPSPLHDSSRGSGQTMVSIRVEVHSETLSTHAHRVVDWN